MKKIKEKLWAIRLFFLIVFGMIESFGKIGDDRDKNFAEYNKICRRIFKQVGLECKVQGLENFPEEHCLVISNHISFFDIIVYLETMEKPVGFAYASNLMKMPILRRCISAIGGVSIYTDTKKVKETVNDISNYLSGGNLVVFPEGKCSYEVGEIKPFKRGCFTNLNAEKTSILPVYLKYNGTIKVGKWVVPKNGMEIVVGKPFKPEKDMTPKELAKFSHGVMTEMKCESGKITETI